MGDVEREVHSARMLGCEISTNPLDPLEPHAQRHPSSTSSLAMLPILPAPHRASEASDRVLHGQIPPKPLRRQRLPIPLRLSQCVQLRKPRLWNQTHAQRDPTQAAFPPR